MALNCAVGPAAIMSEAWPKAFRPALFGNLHRRRRISVLGQNVDALVEECLGGIGFLARIEPGVDPR